MHQLLLGYWNKISALGVGHAGWHLRKDMMYEQAEAIAQKMSERNSVPEKQ